MPGQWRAFLAEEAGEGARRLQGCSASACVFARVSGCTDLPPATCLSSDMLRNGRHGGQTQPDSFHEHVRQDRVRVTKSQRKGTHTTVVPVLTYVYMPKGTCPGMPRQASRCLPRWSTNYRRVVSPFWGQYHRSYYSAGSARSASIAQTAVTRAHNHGNGRGALPRTIRRPMAITLCATRGACRK